MSKEYTIEKLSDILDIPEERIDDFLVELKDWYTLGKNTKDLVDTIGVAVGEKVPAKLKMRWIDDGKRSKRIVIAQKGKP